MSKSHDEGFIEYLQSFHEKDDTGAIAALKRSLQSETASQVAAYPYVVPFLPESTYNHWVYFLVAGLYALNPNHSVTMKNLGSTCHELGTEKDNPSSSWVLRFKALLDADSEEVAYHIKSIISMAASKHVQVNYVQLLKDLLNWLHPKRFVQLNWAREFWKLPGLETTTET